MLDNQYKRRRWCEAAVRVYGCAVVDTVAAAHRSSRGHPFCSVQLVRFEMPDEKSAELMHRFLVFGRRLDTTWIPRTVFRAGCVVEFDRGVA